MSRATDGLTPAPLRPNFAGHNGPAGKARGTMLP